MFPLDRADSLPHPHITERVFPFDLDPLFPQISFSKRRRTLQDPPEGRGVDSGAGLLNLVAVHEIFISACGILLVAYEI